MPWNTPGDNNDNNKGDDDPWGRQRSRNKKNESIDDISKKVNEKFGSLFGGGGGKNKKNLPQGSGSPTSFFYILPLLILAVLAFNSFYTIDAGERGVVLRFGKHYETTEPGLHWRIPVVDKLEKVNITEIRDARDRTHMLTKDENIVDIEVNAQYRIDNVKDYVFNVYLPDYAPDQPLGTLHQVMRSAMREVAGRNTMDSILKNNRAALAPETQQVMQEILNDYGTGIEVIKVNVTFAEAPAQVKDAFDDANRAREDADRYKNQAETYASKVVPVAEGNASRLLEDAIAYESRVVAQSTGDASRFSQLMTEYKKAPEVTRKRLYLETIESVYKNSKNIMVDTKSGNNLLYLPLNETGSSSGSSVNSTIPSAVGSQLLEKARQAQNDSLRSQVRSGQRQGR